jgi:transposase
LVSDLARRHGAAQSLLFAWRRQARTADPVMRDGSIFLPVEIDATASSPVSEAARPSRAATNGRRPKAGVIEIELGSGSRVRVNTVNDLEVPMDDQTRPLSQVESTR